MNQPCEHWDVQGFIVSWYNHRQEGCSNAHVICFYANMQCAVKFSVEKSNSAREFEIAILENQIVQSHVFFACSKRKRDESVIRLIFETPCLCQQAPGIPPIHRARSGLAARHAVTPHMRRDAGLCAHAVAGRRPWPTKATPDATASAPALEEKSDEYSKTMQSRMGTSLTYNHEAGLDYNRVLPDLIVGSCLQTAADVDRLAEQEGVKVVYCLQGKLGR